MEAGAAAAAGVVTRRAEARLTKPAADPPSPGAQPEDPARLQNPGPTLLEGLLEGATRPTGNGRAARSPPRRRRRAPPTAAQLCAKTRRRYAPSWTS